LSDRSENLPQNADFLRAFTSRAVTPGERAASSKDDELTQDGAHRMGAAVLSGPLLTMQA